MLGQQYISTLEWNSELSTSAHVENFRKRSIICTLGPKTQSVDMIEKLIQSGMNIARMNFSHGNHTYHKKTIDNIREAERKLRKAIGIALDTKGPEIRTGDFENGQVHIPNEHEMEFSLNPQDKLCGNSERLYIDYPRLSAVVKVGDRIYIDDGNVSFEVLSVEEEVVRVRSMNECTLSNKRGVNLPDSDIDLPALSAKDRSDLKFGVENNIDIVFASFIRTAADVREIREFLGEEGKFIKIISKIESRQGVKNIDQIIEAADGVMIARGDLGIEIPPHEVFLVQKRTIAKCNIGGKPVIVATQMLESMIEKPRPTRAEVSDIANAIHDGADCVMLSGETAKGAYPIEAVEMMDHVVRLAESTINYSELFNEVRACSANKIVPPTEATAASAVNAAEVQDAKAIIALSTTGNACRLLAKYRPQVPVFMVTRNPHVARQGHLHRGVYPIHFKESSPDYHQAIPHGPDWQANVDERVKYAVNLAKQKNMLKNGDIVVLIQGWCGGEGHTNTMRTFTVSTDDPKTIVPGEAAVIPLVESSKKRRFVETDVDNDDLSLKSPEAKKQMQVPTGTVKVAQ